MLTVVIETAFRGSPGLGGDNFGLLFGYGVAIKFASIAELNRQSFEPAENKHTKKRGKLKVFTAIRIECSK